MGGRRKSNRMPKKEKAQAIKTIFDCALCGYKNCVIVKIKKVIKIAELNCDKCQVTFTTKIKGLDEAIDVFHKWLAELKQKKLTKDQPETRFDDNSSADEGSGRNVEEILKDKGDADNKSQFSADSLDEKNPQQTNNNNEKNTKGKLKKQHSDDGNNNEEDDDDDDDDISDESKLDSERISDIDSLLSDADDAEEIIKKFRKR
ncbi:unnamed protein product [Paramecium primaurelia]|uniref:Transcription elongation factor 1 homolog n=1 Tax=Paramecium primaurelia TaxID=5886 RepID=A0A8S1K402_PARPR|nr:unnamed protein product [Paramecium primaurelia]